MSNEALTPARSARIASYRLQLRDGLTLADLCESGIIEDLASLGVSHLHLSPVLVATAGSTHGYDVTDHARVDPAIGGDEAFARLAAVAQRHGVGIVVDIVPNHMAADPLGNAWWWDVLANGRSSEHADTFDIDWDGPEERLRGLVLLPVLPDHLGREVERGAFRLEPGPGGLVVVHEAVTVPIEPRSSSSLVLDAADRPGGETLRPVGERLAALAPFDSPDPDDVAHRREVAAGLAADLHRLAESPRCREALDAVLAEVAADPDRLDALLMAQPYRLSRWRAGLRDLAYRRFFDVNGLVALRVDRDEVFEATHARIRAWLDEGSIDGLRVDHPDGLREPGRYLDELRGLAPDAWIVVEKILEPHEDLPPWPVEGSTGYEVGELISRLHLDDAGRPVLAALTDDACGHQDVHDEIVASTRQVLGEILAADVNRLTETLLRVCERHRRFRDFHRHELHGCLVEMLANFGVYRLYTGAGDAASPAEIEQVKAAVAGASSTRPDLDPELFELVARLLCSDTVTDDLEVDFRLRFHQLSGPAKAKGQEDTAWYRLTTLLHRTEVGADAEAWGLELSDFHDAMALHQQRWPEAMTTLSTHDSKRSEDVRARLAVLSELADEWSVTVTRWRHHLARPDAIPAPDPATEMYLLQTLVGAHPLDLERARTHVRKAVREAKRHTSWLDPDEAYEAHLELYLEQVLADPWLRDEIERFVERIDGPARRVSLSQKALQLTVPGVPDLYQGSERWYRRLVDPDNRSPIDAAELHRVVLSRPSGGLDDDEEGLTKTALVRDLLWLRRRHRDAFGPDGTYEPLWATGPRADHAVAFARGGTEPEVVVVAARRVVGLSDGWGDTRLGLPAGQWVDVADPAGRWRGDVELDALLGGRSVAVLEAEHLP